MRVDPLMTQFEIDIAPIVYYLVVPGLERVPVYLPVESTVVATRLTARLMRL